MPKENLLNFIYSDIHYENPDRTTSDQERAAETISLCRRGISLVIYFGHHLILQSILDQIIRKSRNVHNNVQDSNKTTTSDRNGESIDNFDYNITGIIDSLEEQYCLLCISCYSGELNTVRILLKYIDKNAIFCC